MVRKLPAIPERRLRVFAAQSRVVEGIFIRVLRIVSGKPSSPSEFAPSQFSLITRSK
jgi:hypothetical protein